MTGNERWQLRLYVRGQSPLTQAAVQNLQNICHKFLAGKHSLEIIDIDLNKEQANADDIIALPTLVRVSPKPIRRVVGDLSDEQRVMIAMNLPGSVIETLPG